MINTKISESIKIITKEINSDPAYREAWKSSIAMSFKDEYYRMKKEIKQRGGGLMMPGAKVIHEIANSAADNFLNMLCNNLKTKK